MLLYRRDDAEATLRRARVMRDVSGAARRLMPC